MGTVALAADVGIRETRAMRSRRHRPVRPAPYSAFAGYRFPPEVITLAVRRYLRFGLSYRDLPEIFAGTGVVKFHPTDELATTMEVVERNMESMG
jgi:transposase-like protein